MTQGGDTKRGGSKSVLLTFAHSRGATERVDIPEEDVFGEIFDSDFALHFCSLAQPNHAELGF